MVYLTNNSTEHDICAEFNKRYAGKVGRQSTRIGMHVDSWFHEETKENILGLTFPFANGVAHISKCAIKLDTPTDDGSYSFITLDSNYKGILACSGGLSRPASQEQQWDAITKHMYLALNATALEEQKKTNNHSHDNVLTVIKVVEEIQNLYLTQPEYKDFCIKWKFGEINKYPNSNIEILLCKNNSDSPTVSIASFHLSKDKQEICFFNEDNVLMYSTCNWLYKTPLITEAARLVWDTLYELYMKETNMKTTTEETPFPGDNVSLAYELVKEITNSYLNKPELVNKNLGVLWRFKTSDIKTGDDYSSPIEIVLYGSDLLSDYRKDPVCITELNLHAIENSEKRYVAFRVGKDVFSTQTWDDDDALIKQAGQIIWTNLSEQFYFLGKYSKSEVALYQLKALADIVKNKLENVLASSTRWAPFALGGFKMNNGLVKNDKICFGVSNGNISVSLDNFRFSGTRHQDREPLIHLCYDSTQTGFELEYPSNEEEFVCFVNKIAEELMNALTDKLTAGEKKRIELAPDTSHYMQLYSVPVLTSVSPLILSGDWTMDASQSEHRLLRQKPTNDNLYATKLFKRMAQLIAHNSEFSIQFDDTANDDGLVITLTKLSIPPARISITNIDADGNYKFRGYDCNTKLEDSKHALWNMVMLSSMKNFSWSPGNERFVSQFTTPSVNLLLERAFKMKGIDLPKLPWESISEHKEKENRIVSYIFVYELDLKNDVPCGFCLREPKRHYGIRLPNEEATVFLERCRKMDQNFEDSFKQEDDKTLTLSNNFLDVESSYTGVGTGGVFLRK